MYSFRNSKQVEGQAIGARAAFESKSEDTCTQSGQPVAAKNEESPAHRAAPLKTAPDAPFPAGVVNTNILAHHAPSPPPQSGDPTSRCRWKRSHAPTSSIQNDDVCRLALSAMHTCVRQGRRPRWWPSLPCCCSLQSY
ncbi:hypothetical protein DENSPDRAFT_53045 [Dentipellis sp. KUC8613]|nr:hypothetical protein DENSPDRAFT_53045 [Dentipellis sp. KUC8613]